MKDRHGFTLLEVTLSLALLSGIALASTALVSGVSRNERDIRDFAQWRRAADEVLARIGDDLTVGDFAPAGQADASTRKPRVRVGGDALEIETRARDNSRGPVVVRYATPSGANAILRIETDLKGSAMTRVLLPESSLTASLDAESSVLSIEVRGQRTQCVKRRLRLQ